MGLKNLILKSLICIGFLFFYMIVHELGHIIACMLLNVRVYEITLRNTEMGLCFAVIRDNTSLFNEIIIKSGGVIAQFLIGIILCLISYILKNMFLYINSFIGIFCGLVYWNFGLWVGFGDSYEIYQLLDISYHFFVTISLIFTFLSLILFIKFSIKITKYGWVR